MAIFSSYAPPGVYTQEIFNPQSSAAIGTARIPVIIGEGQQFFTFSNIELFRGSSAVQDDQAVNEDISNQVTGFTRSFQTTYFPVVDGTGKGVVTNDPAKMKVISIDADGNQLPVTVISLNGATGQFSTQEIIPQGTALKLTYAFKRGDTLVSNEDLSSQIPAFAALSLSAFVGPFTLTAVANSVGSAAVYTGTITGGSNNAFAGTSFAITGFATSANNGTFLCTASSAATLTLSNATAVAETHAGTATDTATASSITLSTTLPGELSNSITVQLVAGIAVTDALAVAGAGTDGITINLTKASGRRTIQDLINLINAGIPTLSGGFLAVKSTTGVLSTPLVGTVGSLALSGGTGGQSNTVFKVKNTPIVDGTNGGVISTNPANVTVLVSGSPAIVAAVDGAHGLITMANPVPSTASSFTATYFTNTWQNTFDLLPASNIASIVEVGLGPNRQDFVQGTDYVLGVDASGNGTINWGASVNEAIGVSAAGENAPFSPAEVLTSLRDEKVFLRPAIGSVNGKNIVFTLQDNPVDGSGLARITDDPTKVRVYVGADALEAFLNGAVRVTRLSGSIGQITLYNPPASGQQVFASYYRSTLGDHQYSVAVVSPQFGGSGSFTISDELDRFMPLVTFTSGTVTDAGFAASGVIYPFSFPDGRAIAGAAINETVTLTFRNDGVVSTVPATQASLTLTFTSGITFTASQPGAAGNNVQIAINVTDTNSIPVAVSGDLVTIFANWDGSLHTLAQIAGYFPSAATASGGRITAASSGTQTPTVTAPTNLATGTDAQFAPVSHSYTVSSNQTLGSSGIGYLNQTYIDARTGFTVTVLDAAAGIDLSNYGSPTIPTHYSFAPADTLVFGIKADSTAIRNAGTPGVSPAQANTLFAIPGLNTSVISTFQSTAGDSVVVSTFNKSGNNPNVGEFYFITFTTNKTAADYALKIYTNPSNAYAQYGQPSTVNRLSLGIQLMSQNGMQTFGAIQVPVQPGTNLAASSDYVAALQQLTKHLPGSTRKADVIVPLSNDPTVHQALSVQLLKQAGPRQKGEAIGFVGYSQFTTPDLARANARALHNSRMVAIGNVAAGILITNGRTGVAAEFPVDGPFMAAAMAGLNCNPLNDVATTLTLQNMAGFSRLLITYDDPTMDFMAADGLTLLLNNNGALQIRHYKTTDPSNDLTSEPTSITISDFVAQQFRADLQQFIGRKLIDSLVTDITTVCNARLKSLVDNVIISGYQNLSVVVDPLDPTQVDVTVTFKPIFSLLYANVTFVVQTSL